MQDDFGRYAEEINGSLTLYGSESLNGENMVFVVDERADVDAMRELGYPCVCIEKWNDDYCRIFANLEIYLLSRRADLLKNSIPFTNVYVCDYSSIGPVFDYIRRNGKEAAVNTISEIARAAVRKYSAKRAADFGEDNTSFVWYPYIPIGDYTVLMAPGGTGKTYFICGIAAAISRGQALPGDETAHAPGPVLIISAEDRGELLKRRLAASGADLNNVLILDCTASEGLNFTDGYMTFKAVIKSYSPRLVVIDPWHGFLGASVDINRVNAVRPVFQRLANIAKDCGCGMILISHVNKRAQGENVNNAATGSTDFVNASRSALYIIFDEESEDRRVVVHTKSNYARYGESVCFRIENGGIRWDGFSDIDRKTMEQAARQRKTPGEVMHGKGSAINACLVTALLDEANPFEIVRFTYDRFKEKHGGDIFGLAQPKKALDAVAGELRARGYELITGIQVKKDGLKGNGFAIQNLEKST